jgi:hypothetical protein
VPGTGAGATRTQHTTPQVRYHWTNIGAETQVCAMKGMIVRAVQQAAGCSRALCQALEQEPPALSSQHLRWEAFGSLNA